MATGGTYRIIPSLLFKYALQKRVLGIFWDGVSYSDRFDELVYIVKSIDGRLVNAHPTPEEPKA